MHKARNLLFCFNWLSASVGLLMTYCTVRQVASLVFLVSSLMAGVYPAND